MGLMGKLFGRSPERPADIYTQLRARAIDAKTSDLGLSPDPSAPIYGVVMETGFAEATATFVCLGDGSVSLYLSTGGGSHWRRPA